MAEPLKLSSPPFAAVDEAGAGAPKLPLVLSQADMAVAVVEVGMPNPNPSPTDDANAAEAEAADTELLPDGNMAEAATGIPCPKDGRDAVGVDGQGL